MEALKCIGIALSIVLGITTLIVLLVLFPMVFGIGMIVVGGGFITTGLVMTIFESRNGRSLRFKEDLSWSSLRHK